MSLRPPTQIMPHIRRHGLSIGLIQLCLMLVVSLTPLGANPVGGTVESGSATFAENGSTLTVTTGTNQTIINWQDFSIKQGELTHFAQPSAASGTLNRVIGSNISEIYGSLTSNGHLTLINQNGVLIGASGMVSTAGFTASTLNVSNQDWLNWQSGLSSSLNWSGNSTAGIQNLGTIQTQNGDIVLIAQQIKNEGTIRASTGTVTMLAGKEVELYLAEVKGVKGLVRVKGELPGQTAIENTAAGLIEGVKTHLEATGNIYALAIQNDGKIRATGSSTVDGVVYLTGKGGTVINNGQLIATNAAANGVDGGKIVVEGDNIANLANAIVDASGTRDGGMILIGGDYQGNNAEVYNAQKNFVAQGALIKADGGKDGGAGNGGKIIVWADDWTQFYGQISGRGGALGGDGGFAEVSGKQHLDYQGFADMRAPLGQIGTLLLDPTNITIDNSANANITAGPNFASSGNTATSTLTWATINTSLSGANVTVTTASGGPSTGTITIGANGALSGNNTLTLQANSTISMGNFTITRTGGTGGIIMNAVGDITIGTGGAAAITTAGGLITLNSTGGNILLNGNTTAANTNVSLTTAGGAVNLTAGGGNITLASNTTNSTVAGRGVKITTGGGAVTMNASAGSIILQSGNATAGTSTNITTGGGVVNLTASNNVTFTTADASTTTNIITSGAGSVNITATNGNIDYRGISTTGANVTMVAGNIVVSSNTTNTAYVRSTGGAISLTSAGNITNAGGWGDLISGGGNISMISNNTINTASTINASGGAGGTIRFHADNDGNGTGNVTTSTVQTSGVGGVSYQGVDFTLNQNVSGAANGTASLQRSQVAGNITIGTGQMIDPAELGRLTGFGNVVIGRTDSTGSITVATGLAAANFTSTDYTLQTNGTISFTGNFSPNGANQDVRLVSGTGITQAANTTITTNGLSIGGSGNATLGQANVFTALATNATGNVNVTRSNAGALSLGTVTVGSSNITGVNAYTGNLTLTGDISNATIANLSNTTLTRLTLNDNTGGLNLNSNMSATGAVNITVTGGGLAFQSNITAGSLDARATGAITQLTNSTLTVTGSSSFNTTLAATGNVTLKNTGASTQLASSVIGGHVDINSAATILGAAQWAGNLAVTGAGVLAGNFSSTGDYDYFIGTDRYIGSTGDYSLAAGTNVTGNLFLNAATGATANIVYTGTAINLAGTNNLQGAISLNTNASFSGGSNVVTVSQGGAINVAGATSLTLTNGILNWNTSPATTNLTGAVSVTNTGTGAVNLNTNSALQLGNLSLGTGVLNLTANGNITQATGTSIVQATGAGAVAVNAGGNSITLNNQGNDFTGVVSTTQTGTGATRISDANSLALGTVTLGSATNNRFRAGDGFSITQTGAMTNTGTVSFVALNGNLSGLTLNNAGNQLGTIGNVVSTGAVQLTSNTGALTVNSEISGSSITINSGAGALALNGAVTGTGAVQMTSTAGGVTVGNTLSGTNVTINAGSGAVALNGAVTGTGVVQVTSTAGGVTVGNTLSGTDITINAGSGAVALNGAVTGTGAVQATSTAGGVTVANTLSGNSVALNAGTGSVALNSEVTATNLLSLSGGSVAQTAKITAGELKVTTTSGDTILQNVDNQITTLSNSTVAGKFYLYDSLGGITIGSGQTVAATGAVFLNNKGDITFASGSKLTSGSRVTLLTEGTFINQSGGDPFGSSKWRAYVNSTPTLGGITTTPATDKVALAASGLAAITDPNTLPDPKSGEVAAVYSIGSGVIDIKPPVLDLPSPPVLEKREDRKEEDAANSFVIKDVNKIIDVYENYLAGLGLDAAPVTEGELAATESSQIFGNTVTLNAPSPLFMLEAISVSIEVNLRELLQADLSQPVPVGSFAQNETVTP